MVNVFELNAKCKLMYRLQILIILVYAGLTFSCINSRKSVSSENEDQLVTTRRFAGVFIDYRATVTDDLPKVEVIWIKTSLENRFGKICALGKKCEFKKGDRLYLTRKYFSPGMVGGLWEFYIENDSEVKYQLTDYQSDKKVLSESWF